MPYSKRILITGGTGLIGQELYQPLAEHGFEPYVITIDKKNPQLPHVTYLKANLFNENDLSQVLTKVQPQYLLNLAWHTHGDYQTSLLNFDFVQTGLALLKHFAAHGGQRAVFAGTCMEYAPKSGLLTETDKISPLNLYARCKNALHQLAQDFCSARGISFAYGRVFYVYGKNEHPSRLTSSVLRALYNGEKVQINCSHLQRDYMYAKDIAAAFVCLTDSSVQGAVNICTGRPLSLEDYVRAIARQVQREDLLVLKRQSTSQPLLIAGDNTRLVKEVGFTPTYTLDSALAEIVKKPL